VSAGQDGEGSEGYKELERIAAALADGKTVEPVAVRKLLGWFGAAYRGVRTNAMIRRALAKNNLRIDPDIHAAHLDGEIEFRVGSGEFDWLRATIRSDLLATRVASWIDGNPTVTESEIEAKAEAIGQLGIGDLSRDEADEIWRVFETVSAIKQKEDVPWRNKRLEGIANSLKVGKTVAAITVRELLRWFGAEHRSVLANFMIRQALREHNLRSEPNFNRTSIDGAIRFRVGSLLDKLDVAVLNDLHMNLFYDRLSAWCDQSPGATESEVRAKAEALQRLSLDELGLDELAAEESAEIIPFRRRETGRLHQDVPTQIADERAAPVPDQQSASFRTDQTFCIGRIPSANVPPKFLRPNQTVAEALTILLQDNSSRIPVISGGRDVKCVVSWGWICMRLAQGAKAAELQVHECKDKPQIVDADTPLHEATEQIKKHGYVLVRGPTKNISGIVTESDLFEEVREFLVLGEIEDGVRRLIGRAGFREQELREARDPSDTARSVKGASDLTFGEYIRLLERPESWSKLSLSIDRTYFVKELERIKSIRNDVMHFRGIGEEQFDALRKFASFLKRLQPMIGP
jgi:CBS domain-containing protein